MRGSVVKRDTRYYVKIELDPDPLTGKRRQKWHSGFRTKREAEKARIDLLSKFDRGEYVEPTQQTVAEYLTDWLTAIEHTVRPSTFDSYSRNMHNHVIAHIGSTKLTKVDAGVLNGLYSLLLTSGRRLPSRTGRGYSSAVVARAQELRADGLSLAATAEQLRPSLSRRRRSRRTRSPRSSADRGSAGRSMTCPRASTVARSTTSTRSCTERSRTPSAGDASPATQPTQPTHPAPARSPTASRHGTRRRCARSSNGPATRAIDCTRCGCCSPRPACAEARRSDSAGRTSTSTPAAFASSRRSPRREQGDDRRTEDVERPPLDRTRRRDGRGPPRPPQGDARGRMLVGPDFSDEGLVFHQPDGACLRPDAVSAQFVRRARFGLSRLTLHGLRHTWATLALEQGIHPRVVQERLGHSTIAITLGIYSHVSPTLHDEAARQIASLLL